MTLANFQLSVLAVNPIKTLSTVTAHPFNKKELDAIRLIHSSIRSISLNNMSLLSKLMLLNIHSPNDWYYEAPIRPINLDYCIHHRNSNHKLLQFRQNI